MGAVLPEEAYAAALAGLPVLKPERLRWLVDAGGGVPSEAWRLVAEGRLADGPFPSGMRSKWKAAALARHPMEVLEACRAIGVGVLVPGMGAYPARLAGDPAAPAVLFARGSLDVLDAPTAGVVGTRTATGYGRDAAVIFGRELARAGVAVVSGLASGVDAAAHRGALRAQGAPVVAVVGTGLDVVYPESSRPLWEAVGATGLIVSEAPLGAEASAWRFPARNRIMAGLSDAVVVVESHVKGGALITASVAADLGRPVLAVPGPVTSPASAGCNNLLADGALVARDADDVLTAIGVDPSRRRRRSGGRRRRLPLAEDAVVLDLVDVTATTMDQLMARSGRWAGELAVILQRLEDAGWVEAGPGWWRRRPEGAGVA